MAEDSIRDLGNRGGEVVDRATAGERAIITRSGKPVAELRPLGAPVLSGAALLARWRRLPVLDLASLRVDTGKAVDPSP